MRKLRLLRLASFNGYGVEVKQREPVIDVDDVLAEKLLRTGYFEDLTRTEATHVEFVEPPGPFRGAPKRKGGKRK